MRFISFKALIALVILPPMLYVAALVGIERVLEHRYRVAIEKQVPGDTEALLTGRERLGDHIAKAAGNLLAGAPLRNHGVTLTLAIRTEAGRWLYPAAYRDPSAGFPGDDPLTIASENFALLNEGLVISLDVTVAHNTTVSNGLLAVLMFIALGGVALVYRRGRRAYAREEAQRRLEQDLLRAQEEEQKAALSILESQKDALASEIETIQSDLKAAQARAERNEADLFDEVESLEDKLRQNLERQEQQKNRISELEAQLALSAKEREVLSQQQSKAAAGLRKRMETLYKNATFSDRALTALAELPESMQIKAEEVIHQLNAQPDEIAIKRKLFRGKGKETVFEIVFARKGRLYFRRNKARKLDILVIGTKNTQERDLVYLDRHA